MMSNNRWAKTNTGMHRLRELLFDTQNTHDKSILYVRSYYAVLRKLLGGIEVILLDVFALYVGQI